MTDRPAKGTAQRERTARRQAIVAAERHAKDAAKLRDQYRCRRCGRLGAEAAHLDDKGMGGDHGLRSSLASDYVSLCADCHRGKRSVHSGHLLITYDPVLRGDGPVNFTLQNPGDRHGNRT